MHDTRQDMWPLRAVCQRPAKRHRRQLVHEEHVDADQPALVGDALVIGRDRREHQHARWRRQQRAQDGLLR